LTAEVGKDVTLTLFALIVAATVPSPTASPLKEIYHAKSTPFCTVFRENVFYAVQGLRINDAVFVEGKRILDSLARDAVSDPGGGAMNSGKPKRGATFGNSAQLDRYRSGQAAHAVADNLTKIYQLLSDTDRFPADPQTDAERDLALMKKRLLAVADAQERSLNILEGTYESDSLDDLLSRNSGLEETLGIPAGGVTPAPVIPAVAKGGSLYDTTPVGQIAAGLTVSRALTGSLEDLVAPAIEPGISRCK
jgi:hypothetical protein